MGSQLFCRSHSEDSCASEPKTYLLLRSYYSQLPNIFSPSSMQNRCLTVVTSGAICYDDECTKMFAAIRLWKFPTWSWRYVECRRFYGSIPEYVTYTISYRGLVQLGGLVLGSPRLVLIRLRLVSLFYSLKVKIKKFL